MKQREANADDAWHYEQTALLLQGGGALGSYHHGVYEALCEAGHEFDWVVGTSIGGIQCAIIAGNPPERRLERLREFWDRITWPQYGPAPPADASARKAVNLASAMTAMLWGQPGFFRPHMPPLFPWSLSFGPQISHYDVSPLRETLEALIDFELLNDGGTRLSLGAVEVETGCHVYFDSRHQRIDIRHVLATGALPPAFPPVAIDGHTYWDGGLLSNTPLSAVVNDNPRRSTLCFMVDLFDPKGLTPTDMDELEDRRKDIIYASRSHVQLEDQSRLHALRRAVDRLFKALPESAREDPELRALGALGCTTTMQVVHVVYRGQAYHSSLKDFTFLPATLEDHRRCGYEEACRVLARRPWDQQPVSPYGGIIYHEANAVADHF